MGYFDFLTWPIQYIGLYPTIAVYTILFGTGVYFLFAKSLHELEREVRTGDAGFEVTKRKLAALTVLVIAILAIQPVADAYGRYASTFVVIPSASSDPTLCKIGNTCGIPNSVTLFTASPTTIVTEQFLSGTKAITILAGTSSAQASQAFSPAFTVTPKLALTASPATTPGAVYGPDVWFASSQPGSQMISGNQTQASFTIPNADKTLNYYALPANAFTTVTVEASGYLSFVAISTNQNVNIKVKANGVQVGPTTIVDAALGATSKVPWSIAGSLTAYAATQLNITAGAAAADANTNVFINSLRVSANYVGNIWTGFPAAKTDLLGNSTFDTLENLQGVNTVNFCVTTQFVGLGTESFEPQYSSDDASWFEIGSVAGSLDLTLTLAPAGQPQCINATVASGARLASAYLRVVGSGGDGLEVIEFSQVHLQFLDTAGTIVMPVTVNTSSACTTAACTFVAATPAAVTANLVVTVSWSAVAAVSSNINTGSWISMPNVPTEFLGGQANEANVTIRPFTQARLIVDLTRTNAGSGNNTGVPVWIQASLDGLVWDGLCGTVLPSIRVDGGSPGVRISPTCTINKAFFTGPTVQLRILSAFGFLSRADFGLVMVEFF